MRSIGGGGNLGRLRKNNLPVEFTFGETCAIIRKTQIGR